MIVQDTVIQIQSKYTYRGLYKTLTERETSILDRCLEVAQVIFGLVFSTLHLLLFWYCFFFLTCRVVLYTWSGNWKTASIFCYPNLWSIVLFCKTCGPTTKKFQPSMVLWTGTRKLPTAQVAQRRLSSTCTLSSCVQHVL